MPDITRAPSFYLGFVAWHLFAGFLGTSLIFWVRFGRFPNELLRHRVRWTRHRKVQIAMGPVSIAWIASVVLYALDPLYRATAWGRPWFSLPPVAGWIVAGVAHVCMVGAQLAMGPALRVGLDESGEGAPTDLALLGPFRISRNPVYLCSILFLLGEWSWHPNWGSAFWVAGLAVGFHFLAVEEERVLAARFGASYASYREQVPRWVGVRRNPRSART